MDKQSLYDTELLKVAGWKPRANNWYEWIIQKFFTWQVFRGLSGVAIFFLVWYFLTSLYIPPRFEFIPNPLYLFTQWISPSPENGISIFSPVYYRHIFVSMARVYAAFALATALGVPLGLMLGWNKVFSVVELLRPIPPLAWVPLAVLMLYGVEMPVIFVTMMAGFFATVLNSYLGVVSIDQTYFRAAACLGFNRWKIFTKVIVPGALPFIFTGLQIAMGVAWFSLVGGEIIAGKSGLGFLIFEAYQNIQLVNIFIAMITLGSIGYLSSVLIRHLGNRLMIWQLKDRG